MKVKLRMWNILTMINVWEDGMIKDSKQCGVKVDNNSNFYECLYCESTGDIILREDHSLSYSIDEITDFGRDGLDFTYTNNMLLCKLSGINYSILLGDDIYEKYYCSNIPEVSHSFTVFNVIHGKRKLGVFSNISKAKSYILFDVFLANCLGVFPNIVSSNGGNILYEDLNGEILYISEEVIQ